MGVYLQGENWATQGPAPSGFHVPLNTEWQAVYDVWTTLGGGSTDGTNFGIALKLPFAGYRYYSSAGVYNQGTYGLYWSSSRYNASNAYRLYFDSTALNPQDNSDRANGFSVRCFKNEPTVPTSFWTKLYGTSIESGGIFWSSEDGLISLSSDGNTWITIADKNLGATTVWNNGDTLSEANCGKYYQRGNNYGFPFTGSVTTSSTQVDASNYGPGNYYNSSTFITRSGTPYRWDTTDNGNLRGGVDGNVPTMTELKNAYIGEVYEYSYDFRNKTSTQVTNDGWTVGSGYTFDANGIGSSNWSPVTKAIPFSLENARKITFTCGLYNTNTGLSSVSIQNTASSNTNSCYIYTDYDRPALSGYGINGAKTNFTYTPLSGQSSRIYTIDLENLTFNIVCGTFTTNGTITQADADGIRNNKYFNIIIRYGTCRIQYIDLLVE